MPRHSRNSVTWIVHGYRTVFGRIGAEPLLIELLHRAVLFKLNQSVFHNIPVGIPFSKGQAVLLTGKNKNGADQLFLISRLITDCIPVSDYSVDTPDLDSLGSRGHAVVLVDAESVFRLVV